MSHERPIGNPPERRYDGHILLSEDRGEEEQNRVLLQSTGTVILCIGIPIAGVHLILGLAQLQQREPSTESSLRGRTSALREQTVSRGRARKGEGGKPGQGCTWGMPPGGGMWPAWYGPAAELPVDSGDRACIATLFPHLALPPLLDRPLHLAAKLLTEALRWRLGWQGRFGQGPEPKGLSGQLRARYPMYGQLKTVLRV